MRILDVVVLRTRTFAVRIENETQAREIILLRQRADSAELVAGSVKIQ